MATTKKSRQGNDPVGTGGEGFAQSARTGGGGGGFWKRGIGSAINTTSTTNDVGDRYHSELKLAFSHNDLSSGYAAQPRRAAYPEIPPRPRQPVEPHAPKKKPQLSRRRRKREPQAVLIGNCQSTVIAVFLSDTCSWRVRSSGLLDTALSGCVHGFESSTRCQDKFTEIGFTNELSINTTGVRLFRRVGMNAPLKG